MFLSPPSRHSGSGNLKSKTAKVACETTMAVVEGAPKVDATQNSSVLKMLMDVKTAVMSGSPSTG